MIKVRITKMKNGKWSSIGFGRKQPGSPFATAEEAVAKIMPLLTHVATGGGVAAAEPVVLEIWPYRPAKRS